MAKRFIDTDIFKKQFMRNLETPYKLLWIYILQDCNHAGIWEVDFETAQLKIGSAITKKEALKNFSGKILEISEGEKWFIPDFISFQYGQLSESNRAHIGIIQLLKKYDLLKSDLSVSITNKPLASPLQAPTQGAKDMDKDKDKDKDKEMDKDKDKEMDKEKGEKKVELVFPFTGEQFLKTWGILVREKKWRRKSNSALQASLKFLSKHSESEAVEIMERSIAGEWQGLFELDKKNHTQPNGKRLDKNGETIITGRITKEGAARTMEGIRLFHERQKAANGDFGS